MKTIFHSFIFCLGLLVTAHGQEIDIQTTYQDTLPHIHVEKNVLLVTGLVILLGLPTYTIINGNSYKVDNKTYWGTKALSPYFTATNDTLLLQLYEKHRQNRGAWLATGVPAILVLSVTSINGIFYLFQTIFFKRDPAVERRLYAGFIGGAVLLTTSIITRIASFAHLREAVGIYNYKYAQKPPVTLSLCTSSSGLGVGLALRF